MSQGRLGQLLGLTFQQIQKYEKGLNRIGAGRLFEVAGILGVPISFFYEDADSNAQAGSFAEGEEPPPVMEFLASGEGLQLSLAFTRIKDVKIRKRILYLVRQVVGSDLVQGWGGQVVLAKLVDGHSTTATIAKLQTTKKASG